MGKHGSEKVQICPPTVGAVIKGVIANTLNIGGAALTTAGDVTQSIIYTIGGWVWPY